MKSVQYICRLSAMLGIAVLLAASPIHATPDSQTSQNPKTGFSVDKMDPSVDPGKDFYHYSAGHWLDGLKIPNDRLRITGIDLLSEQVSKQLQHILEQAAAKSSDASKGSPLQQVGDFYASAMDEERLKKLGVKPLKPALEKIDNIDSPQTLAKTLGQFEFLTGGAVVLAAGVLSDNDDRTAYGLVVAGGDLGMSSLEDYLSKDKADIRDAYLRYISANLELLGISANKAKNQAHTVLEMETRLAGQTLTPLESRDPKKLFTKMSMAELESLLSNFDTQTFFKTIGLPTNNKVTVIDRKALVELNQMLKEYSLSDIKIYVRWSLLRQTKKGLTPDFVAPAIAFMKTRYGDIEKMPRSEQVTALVPTLFGHPLSQLYVDEYFTEEAQKRVEAMVATIKSIFRQRLEDNSWLSKTTRDAAVEKLDRLVIEVGYPKEWTDYSSIDIRRDDYFGNIVRHNEFDVRRDLAKLGKSVKEDDFSQPGATLPIDINAAYNPPRNKIEIPAAFLQPPFFDENLDEAVNYCSIGAAIGHEITHGFDSSGRLYDADGNIRDWWTDEDAAKFVTQTEILVAQANGYEILPGLHMNGKLTVTENLADVGGVSLAYQGLLAYLKEHPEANRKIDGYTPQQRCFIAWAQLWAGKSREGLVRQLVETDAHSFAPYRTFAPSQHEAGFFTAFDIEPGDTMWRDEKDRVKIW